MSNNIMTLKSGSQFTDNAIVVPLERLGIVSYLCSLSLRHIRLVKIETSLTLKTGLISGHSRSSEPTRIDPPPMTSY